MRSKDVVGRRIVAVEQSYERTRDGKDGSYCWVVWALVLDNGTRICPVTVETDFGEYMHEFVVQKGN